jgi:hypothetical protein
MAKETKRLKTFKVTVKVTVDLDAYDAEYGEFFAEDEVFEDIKERVYEGASSNLYSLVQGGAVTDYGIKE